ncbi:lactococcin 972 family bacteriocin [Corynebacterium sp.]|uniref:lactococcin 972 family bacteriocin n=1 Tax=Corynebacterium sp. TaxID=1720 RepID=UPI0034A5C61C
MTRKVLAAGVASLALLGGAGVAAAEISHVGGGVWNHGVSYTIKRVWSNYQHHGVPHGSTACNAKACDRSPTVPKGVESKAGIRATLGGNATYWRH